MAFDLSKIAYQIGRNAMSVGSAASVGKKLAKGDIKGVVKQKGKGILYKAMRKTLK